MTRYIIRRLLWGVVLLIIVVALLFVMFRVLPTADPAKLRAGRLQSPKIIAEIRHNLGLDKSLPAQFWLYIKNLFLHFDLGYSYYSNAPVKELIFNRLPATLSLVLGGAVVWVVTGVGVGIVSARRAGSRLDRASMGTALVLVSAPEYWLGLIVLYLFASDIGQVRIFPGAGSYVGLTSDPVKWFESLILPWAVVAAGGAAIYARLIRGSLIETMGEDYIRTARAKGLSRAPRGAAPRAAFGDQPDRDDPRARHRRADRQLRARRNGLQHPRHRAPELHRDHPCGLPDRARHGAASRRCSSSSPTSSWTSPTRSSIPGCATHERAGAAAARRGSARRVPDGRRRGARCRRGLLRGRARADAGDRRRVGLGQDGLVADDARPHAHAGRTRVGADPVRGQRPRGLVRSRAAHDQGQRDRDGLPGPALLVAPVLQGRLAADRGGARAPGRIEVGGAQPRDRAARAGRHPGPGQARGSTTRTSSPAACASAR